MKQVYEKPDEAAGKGAAAAATVRELLSPKAVGDLIAARLNTIASFDHWSNTDETVTDRARMAALRAQVTASEYRARYFEERVSWMEERFVWKLRRPWHHIKARFSSR
jgi:hypothetical protein